MNRSKFLYACFNIIGALLILSQMPDWKYFKDREGNTYFLDQAGKIHITDIKEYRYVPVSSIGIDYYLNYGITLINDHYLVEGVSVMKSILALPSDNNRIYNAQVKASELINTLKKRNGTRFDVINESASLILIKQDATVRIINDHMRYSLSVPGPIRVLRKRDRAGIDYRYSGILFGMTMSDPGKKSDRSAYDMLIAVDCEKFAVKIKDISQAIDKWKGNLGYDDLIRETIAQDDVKILHFFKSKGSPAFAGYEGMYISDNLIYCIRIISSEAVYARNKAAIQGIIESYKPVRRD